MGCVDAARRAMWSVSAVKREVGSRCRAAGTPDSALQRSLRPRIAGARLASLPKPERWAADLPGQLTTERMARESDDGPVVIAVVDPPPASEYRRTDDPRPCRLSA